MTLNETLNLNEGLEIEPLEDKTNGEFELLTDEQILEGEASDEND
mgnify:CR=1 FL=1|jgi:hypothetical protein|tara:strand:+ start:505 stop:639 length:135 start_codon:yes stop_codon:yes gene_type:complete